MTFIEDLMRKELRLNGCFMSYSAPFPGHEWTDSVQAMLNGQLNVAKMISHRYPLAQTTQVFEDTAARRIAYRKIMLLPE
jgi:L-iditol 2-dehydrogenase